MRTAEELWNRYVGKYECGYDGINIMEFREALAEHNQEIKDLIDEMIAGEENVIKNLPQFREEERYAISVLTELKGKL